jgi:transposase InsO family protein
MPRAIAVPVRQAILERDRHHQDAVTIAKDLQLSPRTVRHLLQRFRLQGPQALAPSYRPGSPANSAVHQAALDYRRLRPGWGAPFIRLHLVRQSQGQPIPCSRNLQRLFARHGLAPARAGRKPARGHARAELPHEVWQMDAAEHIALATKQEVSWLRLVDEATGAFLDTTVFPVGAWPRVPVDRVRQQLRRAFARWGRPGLIRVDNGTPWGSKGDLPTDLALWLIGLGIDLWWSPPRRPQDNGVVERSQGTGKRWGEPGTCSSAEELQERIREQDELQRCFYPYKERKSRMEWWPGLGHSPRGYDEGAEAAGWCWQRVASYLHEQCVARRVDQKGQVSIYNRNLYVGKVNRQKEVQVMFASEPARWVVADARGVILKEVAAPEVSAERIRALQVTNRRQGGGPDDRPEGTQRRLPRPHGKTSRRY